MKKGKKVYENDEASLALLLHCAGSLDQESLHSLSQKMVKELKERLKVEDGKVERKQSVGRKRWNGTRNSEGKQCVVLSKYLPMYMNKNNAIFMSNTTILDSTMPMQQQQW